MKDGKQVDTVTAAYAYYMVPSEANQINTLFKVVTHLALEKGADVLNALDIMQNREMLEECKFSPGNGDLHYYVYNWYLKSGIN